MKFTIITVVKNDKKNLLISLKSILSQKSKNFEYIIYDGMLNDGTKSTIRKYLKKNIKYICKKDKNYYEGLNYAIKIAKGEYVGILNAGDQYYNSNILKKIFKKIRTTKCDLLFGNLIYLDNKNRHTRVWNFPVKKLNLISALKIASPTLFIKKKIAISYPYNIDYSISSDTDFNLQISKKKLDFVYLDCFIVLMKTGGLSTNYLLFLKKMKQDFLILKKYFGITFFFIYIYKVSFKISSFKITNKK